jgi:titin
MAVVGNAQVGLTWDKMTMTAGQTVAGYLVDRCTGTCTVSSGTYTTLTAVTGAPTGTTTGMAAPYYTATGLTNGTAYTFRVRAVYGGSNIVGPAVIVAATPVASAQVAVQLLNSTASTTSVSLNWLAPVATSGNAVIGYKVEYCSTDCGLSSAVFTMATAVSGAPAGATTTLLTFVVNGLSTGTTYAFRVTPVLSVSSTGIPSPSVIFDTPTQTVGAPTALAAAGRLNSVNLTWTPPATTGGYPVLGYRIEFRPGSTGDFITSVANTFSSTPSYTVLNLTAGQLYGFRVTALTAAGPGATSSVATGTPYGAASAPSNLVAAASSGQAQLTWSAPASTGGNPITAYRIEQSVDGGTTWTDAAANTGSTATAYTLTGLDNGVTVLFRVSAVTSAGSGATSNIATAIPSSPAAAPVSLAGLATNAQAVLTWLPPADTGGLPVIGYLVERSTDSNTWTVATANTGSAVPASVQSGLVNGTTYYFRVSAITAGGTGAATAPISVTPFTTPSAPTALTPTPGDGQVVLGWGAPASNGGAVISDYKVDQSLDGGITWTTAIASTSGTRQATITGLTNGAPILFRVFAINAAGVGTPTAAISTSAFTLPDAPTSLAATGANASVLLSWIAPLNTNGSPVSGYRVERSTDGGNTWIVAIANTGNSGTNVVVNNVTNGVSYSFRVSAINAAGAGGVSNTAAATPLTTPSAPTNVTAIAGDTVVALAWDVPTNNGGSTISSYSVERSSNGGVTWTAIASGVSVTTYGDSSLTNGTTYLYRVSAVNAAGTGSSSAGVAAVPAAKASAPTSVVATPGSGAVILTWTAPSSTGGSPITGYKVEMSEDDGETWSTAILDTQTSSTYASVNGLAPGQLYAFRVSAINSAGVGSASSNVTGTPIVVSTVVLSGSAGNGSANLSWTAPTDVTQTGYVVERSVDGATWTSAMTNPTANSTTGTASGLTNGVLYIFRVQVLTSAGPASGYSNYLSLVPQGAPGAPTGLVGTGGDAQVTLRWTAPSSNGGAAITGYKVEYSANGTTWSTATSTTGNQATAYTVTGLTNATAYSFRISAINAVGASVTSVVASSTPYTTPTAPASLSAVAGTSQVVLTWTPPTSNGGNAVSSYTVQQSADGGFTWTTLSSSVTGLTYTATDLSNGSTYAFRVAATNAAGTGVFTQPITSTPFVAPDAPTSVTAGAADSSVALSWTAPTNVPSTSIIGYRVERAPATGSTWTVVAANTASSLTSYTVTGLTNGTEYRFRVTALISAGAGTVSSVVNATPFGVPSIPTGLTATAGDTQVTLAWSAPVSDGGRAITAYVIEKSVDGGATFVTDRTVAATSLTSVITGLTNGTAYVFRVLATNLAGNSGPSTTAASIPFTAPSAPLNLQATSGTNEVTLAWNAPSSTGGANLIGYRIERSTNGGTSWTTVVANTGTTATAFTVGNLTAGAPQTFRVAAVTTGGYGAYSVNVSATAAGLAIAPSGLTATAGNTQVSLSWTAPTSTGGSSISAYVVERSADGGATWSTVSSSVATTTYVVTGLTNAVSYSFRVSAVNASGAGIASLPATAVPFGVPGQPTSLQTIASNSQVVLLWTAPVSDGGSSITGYRIESSANGGTSWTDVAVDTGSASTVYVATGLTNGTPYTFRVSARNTSGVGSASATSSATPAGTPTAPRSVAATSGASQVQLSWVAPLSNGGNAVTGYRIESSADGGSTWTTVVGNTASASTSYTATGLTNGQPYAFRVYALNSVGAGSASAIVSATPTTIAGQPTGLLVTPSNASVVLSWTAPTGALVPSGYSIERSVDGSTWTPAISNTGSSATTANVAGLTNGTLYYFRVAAVNGSGTGLPSASASGTPYAGPSAPRNLTATPASTTASLSWLAPSFNGGNAVTGYQIEKSIDGGATWSVVVSDTATTATTYNASGLSNGVTVSFRVSALNASGVGAASSVVTVVPFAGPTAPSSVTAVANDGAVSLSWSAAGDNGSPVIGYAIEVTTDGTTWSTVATTANPLTTYVVTGLTNGSSYTFRVAGLNAAGVGATTSSASVSPSRTPNAPTSLAVTPANGGAALAWVAPVTTGGSVITGYRIEQSSDNGATWSVTVSDTMSTSTTSTVSGLTNGTSYLFRVRAINANGVGAASTPASVIPAGLPGAPTALNTTPGDGSVVLTFTAPVNDGGNPIVGYRVETSTDGVNFSVAVPNSNTVVPAVAVTGLTNGTTYSFRVSAVNTIGHGAASTTVQSTPATVPNAPVVTATVSGNAQVTVTWNAPTSNGGSAVSSYAVDRSTDGINWVPAASVSASTTSSTITGLANGTMYLFRVSASNGVGASVSSTPVAGLPAGVPSVPRAFVAVGSDSSVALTWDAPVSNGGSPILSYTIERLNGATWVSVATGVTSPSYNVNGLTNGTTYQFRVSALNAVGSSVTTASVSVSPATVPSVATGVTLTPGDSQLSVSWTAPSSNGGGVIAMYRVEQSSGGATWSTAATVSGTSTSVVIAGLSNGTPVSVRVVAINAVGESAPSAPATATPVNVPTDPTLVIAAAGDSSVALEWSAPSGDGGAPIIGYRVESNDGNGWTTLTSSTGNPGLRYIAVGLTNGTNYQFRVSAVNISGASIASNTLSATPFTIAGAPTTLVVTAGNARLDLAWSAPTTTGGRAITGYRIFTSVDGATWTTLVNNTNSVSRTYSYIGLVNGARRYVKIAALTAAGQGVIGDVVSGVPFDDPSAPSAVTLTPGPGELLVDWTAPTSTGGLPVMGYRIESSSDGLAWTTRVSDTGSAVTRALLSGVVGGATTYVRVSAITTASVGATSAPASAVALAAAPNAVTAIAGDASVTLSWTDPVVAGTTGYRIERSVNGAAYSTLVDVSASPLSYVDGGLTNGATYLYRVSVLTGSSVGASSSQALAVPLGTPSAPLNVVATAGDRNVALTWASPSDTGGRTITGYRVESSTDGNTWTTVIADSGAPVLSASVPGLSNGTNYSFRVTALSRSFAGVVSATVTATPATTSGAATALSAIAGDASAVLSWSAPVSNGGSVVTGYRVEQSANGTSWTTLVADTGSSATSATINGLTNGQTYLVRVVPLTAVGAGAPSTGAALTPRGAATAPTALVVVAGSRSASLSWSAPGSDGGSPITGYRILVSTNGGSSYTTLVANTGAASTGYTITGLTNGTPLLVKVAAITTFGVGAESVASQSITPAAPSSAPQSVTVVGGNGSASVTWLAPSSTNGATVTGYTVETSSDGGTTWTTMSTSASSPYTLSSLTNGVTYLVRVSADNAAGSSAPSSSAVVTPAGVPGTPVGLAILSGNGLLSLSWSAPVNSGGLPVTSYVVQTSPDGSTWTTVSAGSPASAAILSGLTNGVAVHVRVAAVNAAGTGAYTAAVIATPSVGALAGLPTNLVATAGDGQVALSWNAPVVSGGTPVVGYRVSQSFDGTNWTVLTAGSGTAVTSYLVRGLTNGVPVSFRVSAINAAGAGQDSTPASSTPRTVPSTPLNLVATPGNGQVTLVWSAPSSNGGSAISSYVVESSTDGGTTWTVTTSTTSLAYVVTGLTNGTPYAFHVSAVNTAGTGVATRATLATPFSTSAAVTGVNAVAGDGQAVVTWSAPANTGGSPVTSYGIAVSNDGGQTFGTERTVTGTNTIVTGLVNGVQAVIRVVPITAGGRGTASTVNVTPRAVPGAPVALTAVASNVQVSLSWTAPADNGGSAITSYAIERALVSGGQWVRIDTTSALSYVSTGLVNGTAYSFRIVATNAAGEGSASVAVNATPATTPSAPQNVTATIADSAITVSWLAPASNGGSVVTSYVVETTTDGTSWTTGAATTSTVATVSGLVNGLSYGVRVRAINIVGSGTTSSVISATPSGTPSAPLALTPVAGNRQISLTWSAPSSDGGAGIIDYLVEASANGGMAWRSVGTVTAPSTATVVSGLTNGVAYVFRVSARNAAGTGAASTWVTAAPVAPPRAPVSVGATTIEATPTSSVAKASIAWVPPTDNGGAAIVGYRIQTSTDGGASWGSTLQLGPDLAASDPFGGLSSQDVERASSRTAGDRSLLNVITDDSGLIDTTTVALDGLTFGVSYLFRIQAYTVIGDSEWQSTSFTPERPVLPPTTPSAVVDARYTPTTNGLRIDWSPAATGAPATAYLIERQRPDGTWENISVTTGTSVVDASALLGKVYTYRITPYSGLLAGEPSLVSDARVPANPIPSIALRIGATGEPTTTRFSVSAKDLRPRARATISLEGIDGSVISILGQPTVGSNGRLSSTGRIPRDLAPGRYVVRLSVIDVYGETVETISTFEVTPTWNPIDTVMPEVPGSIAPPRFDRGSNGGLDLRWDRSTAGAAATSFLIERQRPDGTWEMIGITSDPRFSDPSAVVGETYNYRITPFNGSTAGESTVVDNVRIPAEPRLGADLEFDGERQPKTVNFRWSGRELLPGSTATVRIVGLDGATVAELGRITIGPDGLLDEGAVIPSDLAPGSYRLIIEAVDAYGIDVETTYDFDVTAEWSPSDVVDPNDGNTDEPSEKPSTNDNGMPTPLKVLIYVVGVVAILGVFVLGGWWFFIARRRRDEDDEEMIESGDRP